MLDALARLAYRQSRLLIVLAVAFLFTAAAVVGSTFDVLKPFGFDDPESESIRTAERLESATGVEPSPGLVVLVEPEGLRGSPAARRQLEGVATELADDPAIARAVTAFRPDGDRSMISRDREAAYVLGFFRGGLDDEEEDTAAKRLVEALEEQPGVTVGGFGAASAQLNETVEKDLQRSELFAFPILFLLSFWVFRSLVAALLPLLVGALAIAGALIGLRVGAEVTDLSIFAVNLVTGLGLGLAIDYSLLMVFRFREELVRHHPGPGAGRRAVRWQAMRTTMNTAGRTVVFSGLTVAAAMTSLLIFPQRFLYSMGVGGTLIALFSALVAVTVLPAVLVLLGDRVNALAPRRLQRAADEAARPASAGFWYRLTRLVMRRPLPIATAAAFVMIVAGLPFLRSETVFADAGILPTSASARQVDDALEARFEPGRTTPIIVTARTRPAQSRGLARRVASLDGVEAVKPPVPQGRRLVRIDAFSSTGEFSDRSRDVVREIRGFDTPYPVRVAGTTAEFVDQQASLADHIPIAMLIVGVSTFVVLFLMTGSVVLPIKSLIMNLLTVSAAFGFLVLVFQDGRFETLLGYQTRHALDNANQILLFAVVFGLSTDYGVFLLSRIKEARDAGTSDDDAVAIGLERTGRLVTAAALLLCVAIGALATSSIVFIKEFSLGTAFGVAVDATIIRAFLVPSLMKLLGRWNWWAPAPLRRLHARIGLSEA